MALLSEVKTEEFHIAKILNEYLPRYIRNYIDISTCSIMNMFRDKKSQPIRTLFKEAEMQKPEDNIIRLNIQPGKKVQRLR